MPPVDLDEHTPRPRVDLRSPWDGASAWARILDDGRIQLELYDHGEQARAAFGNDVAWNYTIQFEEKPKLIEALAKRTGLAVSGDEAILRAFAQAFKDVHAIRDWLKEEKIAFEETFDPWA